MPRTAEINAIVHKAKQQRADYIASKLQGAAVGAIQREEEKKAAESQPGTIAMQSFPEAGRVYALLRSAFGARVRFASEVAGRPT